jgi:hypothetical protein
MTRLQLKLKMERKELPRSEEMLSLQLIQLEKPHIHG